MSGAVGFIGLGNIGAPMASRLLAWPAGLVVHDVRPEACDRYVAKGATAAATPAEVAAACDVISVMVQNEDQVRAVLSGPDGILSAARPGTVVAVHSTISAQGAVALADMAAGAGVDVVDAPVSGGAMGAHEGTLAIMVGGPEAAVERCREPFGLMGTMVVHFGPVGAGTNAKITRNLITFASFAVVGEAQRLAEAAGLDLAKLGDVVRHSDRITGGPGAVMLRPSAGRLADDDGLRPIFEHTATLGGKDLHLAAELASDHGLPAPFAQLAEEWLRSALGLDDPPVGS
jgi:3-hydroxyisobutyrate dehydrogenase